MIDPNNITKYDRTQAELEEFALFAICVAGKKSQQTAHKVNAFIQLLAARQPGVRPFHAIYREGRAQVRALLEEVRMGQYTRISNAFMAVSGVDITFAGVVWLESALGPKTARFILLHSRPDQKVAVLDTHILAWMRSKGINTPKQTPRAGKRYEELEKQFIALIGNQDVAEADLSIWRDRSNNNNNNNNTTKT
jgi:hypothetical protein